LEKAIKDTGISNVALAGGVSANSALRKRLHNLGIQKRFNTYVPPLEYTTDNAAMIGIAGYYNYRNGEYASLEVTASAKILF
jgi:N6-L-threonylcarbamoyladenine synthase